VLPGDIPRRAADDADLARGLLVRNGHAEPFAVGPGTYTGFYAGVAAAVRGSGPAPVSTEDALAVVRIIEQVHAAFPARRTR
jgi:predicted dehydrogenase